MFYLAMHLTHFIYGYMVLTIQIAAVTTLTTLLISKKGSFLCTIPQTG